MVSQMTRLKRDRIRLNKSTEDEFNKKIESVEVTEEMVINVWKRTAKELFIKCPDKLPGILSELSNNNPEAHKIVVNEIERLKCLTG